MGAALLKRRISAAQEERRMEYAFWLLPFGVALMTFGFALAHLEAKRLRLKLAQIHKIAKEINDRQSDGEITPGEIAGELADTVLYIEELAE